MELADVVSMPYSGLDSQKYTAPIGALLLGRTLLSTRSGLDSQKYTARMGALLLGRTLLCISRYG